MQNYEDYGVFCKQVVPGFNLTTHGSDNLILEFGPMRHGSNYNNTDRLSIYHYIRMEATRAEAPESSDASQDTPGNTLQTP